MNRRQARLDVKAEINCELDAAYSAGYSAGAALTHDLPPTHVAYCDAFWQSKSRLYEAGYIKGRHERTAALARFVATSNPVKETA